MLNLVETIALSFSSSYFRPVDPLFPKLIFTSSSTRSLRFRSLRSVRCRFEDFGESGCFGGDLYGPYPWEHSTPSDATTLQWILEDKITLFTSDGLVHIGGSLVPRHSSSSNKKQGRPKATQKFLRFQESDYMDPNQVLCLGALFDIAATNGLDMGRRLCIFGFCRSIEMLGDVVEDTILQHGGEIVAVEKASKEDLQEKLSMTLAVPQLWGVPPASETLRFAVRSGGGIVERVYWQWDFL